MGTTTVTLSLSKSLLVKHGELYIDSEGQRGGRQGCQASAARPIIIRPLFSRTQLNVMRELQSVQVKCKTLNSKLIVVFGYDTGMVSVCMLSITGGIIKDGALFRTVFFYGAAFACVLCAPTWKYMKKQPPVMLNNGKLCLAVRAGRSENESSTELPHTHMSAAQETFQLTYSGSIHVCILHRTSILQTCLCSNRR